MTPTAHPLQEHAHLNRRRWLALGALPLVLPGLVACSPQTAPSFQSTDITGAAFGQGMRLMDHHGQWRTWADFKGQIGVVFFGFTHCPDVCPTSMTTMAEVKNLLGEQGKRLQVLFITVDPERDTPALLKEYMAAFDPSFLALRPEPDALKALAASFKVYYRKAEGKTPESYTMDHSAGKYIFDTEGRPRLFSAYGTAASVIAADIRALLSQA